MVKFTFGQRKARKGKESSEPKKQRSFYVKIGFLKEKSGSENEFSQQELQKYRTFKL